MGLLPENSDLFAPTSVVNETRVSRAATLSAKYGMILKRLADAFPFPIVHEDLVPFFEPLDGKVFDAARINSMTQLSHTLTTAFYQLADDLEREVVSPAAATEKFAEISAETKQLMKNLNRFVGEKANDFESEDFAMLADLRNIVQQFENDTDLAKRMEATDYRTNPLNWVARGKGQGPDGQAR